MHPCIQLKCCHISLRTCFHADLSSVNYSPTCILVCTWMPSHTSTHMPISLFMNLYFYLADTSTSTPSGRHAGGSSEYEMANSMIQCLQFTHQLHTCHTQVHAPCIYMHTCKQLKCRHISLRTCFHADFSSCNYSSTCILVCMWMPSHTYTQMPISRL